MTQLDPATIAQAFEAELARQEFPDFCARMDSRFVNPAPFQRLIMDEFAAVESRRTRFLGLSIPPRHTKTTIGCVLLPAFALGRNNSLEIVIASHSVDLAERSSRLARDLLLSDAWPFETRLASDSTAATRWHVTGGSGRGGGGSVRSLGIGSALLGRGADVLIIDDPIADGNSDVECAAAWEWMQTIASGRLNKGGRVIVIMQRLRETDLIGRLLESEIASQFRVVNLPAICEDDSLPTERQIGRCNGEALWPAQYSLDELAVRRQLMGDRAFQSQFLGNPLPSSGDLVKASYLEHRYDRVPDEVKTVFGLDAAAKTGLSNDFSAIAVVSANKSHYFLRDMIVNRVDYPGLKRMLIAAAEMYEPSAIYIEDTSNATALIQELKAETRLPIVPVQAKGSKISRMEAQTGTLESGRLLLPSDRLEAPWMMPFMRQMLALPHSKNDDMADALFIALAKLGRQATYSIGFVGGDPDVSPAGEEDYAIVPPSSGMSLRNVLRGLW